jgi:kynureninase
MKAQVLQGFSAFRAQQGELLHCTAHSHHPWPDCTREAQLQAWEDATTRTDAKWDKVFGQVLPQAQNHIARELNLTALEQVVFAPNTHEFVVRLYSCLDWSRPIKVLSTDHEFHSFSRQTRRLEETGRLQVTRIAAEPYDSFTQRFAQAARSDAWDMVWLSQVLFDSGFVVNELVPIAAVIPEQALCIVDGYHSFMAMPVDWRPFEQRLFFVSGGYKYAMAGEGACFLVVPQGCDLRPVSTGWYADFAGLANPQSEVGYAQAGARFFGATFDPSALYRFNAVQSWLQALGVTTAQIHTHVQALQQRFLLGLRDVPWLPAAALVSTPAGARGNFLSFDLPDAQAIEHKLNAAQIRTDRRGTRLRFGFGLYHDEAFIDALIARLRGLI